jgi:hypothetical protein
MTPGQFLFWSGAAFGCLVTLCAVGIVARVLKVKRWREEWRQVSRADRY